VCTGIDGCFAAAAGNATPPRSVRYYRPLSSCEVPGFDPTVLTSVKEPRPNRPMDAMLFVG
jgi:hypothetical protein